jgi:hypothetical protein
MTRFFLALTLLFAGCAAKSVPASPPMIEHSSPARPLKSISHPPPLPMRAATPAAIEEVSERYHQIEQNMVGAVTRDHVTPEYIRNVERADKLARRKLAIIESSHGHPSLHAIEEARFAVGYLGDVLAEAP